MANGVIIPVNKSMSFEVGAGNYNNAGTGNYVILTLPVNANEMYITGIVPKTGTTDCLYSAFKSVVTGNWYIHCASFATGDAVTNATLNLDVFYELL